MRGSTTRRTFLRAVGVAAVGIAGCAAPGQNDLDERAAPAPDDIDERADPGRDDLDERADVHFRGGLRRQGFHPDATVPASVTRDWRIGGVNTGEHTAAKASPVVAPTGDLIVPGDNGKVYAVTPGGEVEWTASTNPSTRGIHGTPAIANGTVYVGAYDGALYAFDLETGLREWRAPLGDAIGASPAYHDGVLYIAVEFAAPSGSLFAVDAASGDVIHEDDRPTDHPHSSPAIDLDAGRLVFGSNDGSLYAWEYPSLEFAWRFDTGGAIKSPVAIHDDSAFFGSWDGSIYRVALADGTREWETSVGAKVMTAPGLDPEGGVVYTGAHDSVVYALDAATGDVSWSYDTGGLVIGSATVTRDHVLVGSYDTYLYALERGAGRPEWRAESTGWVTSDPLVYDGGIYYTDRATDETAGGLYRLEASP